MNNQAFRKLVYQHSNKNNSSKTIDESKQNQNSSKKIARDAVEQEFKEIFQKRKRGNNGIGFDGDFDASDDDYDDDNNNNDNGIKKKEKDDKKNGQQQKGNRKKSRNEEDGSEHARPIKYRDRAKERRQGKNLDYQAVENLSLPTTEYKNDDDDDDDDKNKMGHRSGAQNNDHDNNNMSKFLGGDEQFTHLVKGLDRTLADKVRREEMGMQLINDNDIDLDEVMEDATVAKVQIKRMQSTITKSCTPSSLSNNNHNNNSERSTLATTMSAYLEKVKKKNQELNSDKRNDSSLSSIMESTNVETNTSAQTIHRSMLTFSLKENRHNLNKHGLEAPYASIVRRQNDSVSSNTFSTLSSCTPIDGNLISKIKAAFHAAIELKKRNQLEKIEKKKKKYETKSTGKTEEETRANDDSNDDDDIYGNLGDYSYVPPISASKD